MTAQKLTQLEDYLAKCGMTVPEFNEIREPTTGLLTNLTSGKTSGGPKSKGEEFVEAVSKLPPGTALMGAGAGTLAIEAGVNIVKTQRATKLAAKVQFIYIDFFFITSLWQTSSFSNVSTTTMAFL